jgi:hypothetical protein
MATAASGGFLPGSGCTARAEIPERRGARSAGLLWAFNALIGNHDALAQTRKRVVRMAEQLPPSARRLLNECPFRDQALVERIMGLIEQRCALTLRRFNAG